MRKLLLLAALCGLLVPPLISNAQSIAGTYKGRYIQIGTPSINTPFTMRVSRKAKFSIYRTISGQSTLTTFQLFGDGSYESEQIANGQTVSIGSGSFKVSKGPTIKFRGSVSSIAGKYSVTGAFKFRGRRVSGIFNTSFGNSSFSGKK